MLKQLIGRLFAPQEEINFLLEAERGEIRYLAFFFNNPPSDPLYMARLTELGLIAAVRKQQVRSVEFLLEKGVSPVPVRTTEVPKSLAGLFKSTGVSTVINDYAFGEKVNALEEAEKIGNAKILSLIRNYLDKKSDSRPVNDRSPEQ